MDEIEKDGAEMLVTKYSENEIAFAVTGQSNVPAMNWPWLSSHVITGSYSSGNSQGRGSRSVCSRWSLGKLPNQGPSYV